LDERGQTWLVLAGLGVATVLLPGIVLAHELGHALVGLTCTEGLVTVRVGRAPAQLTRRIGRLHLELNMWPAHNEAAGLAAVYARYGTGTKVMLALAGPVAGAAMGAAIVAVAMREHSLALIVAGVAGALDSVAQLVPFERHGLRSDGMLLLDAIRERDSGVAFNPAVETFVQAVADVHSRWLVLYTDDASPVRTPARRTLLYGAARALGRNEADADVPALFGLAFAGWCWREVEHGDFTRIREAVLDAVHAATINGLVEPALTMRAAAQLAADAPLGNASPDIADHGARFLAAAFHKMPPRLRPDSTPSADLTFAFRYGVALHDVERVRG
jgi:hypothetical protein